MKAAIGQDSHRFEETPGKRLILGGVVFPGEVGLLANSDGDVVLHAITNAVSGITGRNILGRVADEMCHHQFQQAGFAAAPDSGHDLDDLHILNGNELIKVLRSVF